MIDAAATSDGTVDVGITEVEYARHGDHVLMARLFRPAASSPTPALVDLHGGAWTTGDRRGNEAINLRLARSGVFVMAIEYRVPPQGLYPASVQDVNVAIRWLKASAAGLAIDPDRIGVSGTSSGGHLAVLAAIKPRDARYAALRPDLGGDARVPFVVALWPVICPYSRYRDVVLGGTGGPEYADRAALDPRQMDYWLTEDAMREGSPLEAVERGDVLDLPDILYLQNPTDPLHPLRSAEQFVAAYRAAGGRVELHLFQGERYNRVRTDPDSDESTASLRKIVQFVQEPIRRLSQETR